MVKKKKVSKEQAHEFTKLTLHGNIDDIVREKELMDYDGVGIQEDGLLARFILVEGAPGIGKTRFAREVSQRWSRREILNQYRLVVLLNLRDKRVRESKCINDLFYHSNEKLRTKVTNEVEQMNGEFVLLLYEGYDELPGKLQTQKSIFLQILNRECLPEATVLITTRPSATEFLQDQFKEEISQHIEILGFTSADVDSYAEEVINDKELYTKFTQYLNCYPHIRGLMYVPLNAAIIIEIYKEHGSGGFVPTTLTELYRSLTRGLLLRYLKSHGEYGQKKWKLTRFSDLPEEVHKQFHKICEIAFRGILKDEFIFDDFAPDFNTLDLMNSIPELHVDEGAVVSHNFFHLTLQEFLAAVHVSQKPTKEQLQHFTQTCQEGSSSEYFQASTMSVSHTDIHQDVPVQRPQLGKHVQSSSEMVQPQKRAKLSSPQPCLHVSTTTQYHGDSIVPEEGLHEIQQDSEMPQLPQAQLPSSSDYSPLPQAVLPHQGYILESQVISLPKRQQRPFVSEAPASTISSSQELASRPKVPLFTSDHFQSVQRFTAGLTKFETIPLASLKLILLQEEGDRKHITLNSLHWLFEAQYISAYSEMIGETAELTFDYGKKITPFDSYVLGYALSHSNCAWDINLNKSHIGDEGLAMLVAGMHHKDMSSEATNPQSIRLDVAICEITSTGLRHMDKIPQEVAASITELSLSENGRIREGVASLLSQLKSLKALDLTDTDLTPQEIEQLAESLSNPQKLECLKLSFVLKSPDSTGHIFSALSHNTTLRKIVLERARVSEENISLLTSALRTNTTLKILHLVGCEINDHTAREISEALCDNSTLLALKLGSNTNIGLRGATALADMLKKNETLQELFLYNISIGEEGALKLAQSLKWNTSLEILDLSTNPIGNSGATAFAEMLTENKTLKQLDLRNGSIGKEGFRNLALSLNQNSTLEKLMINPDIEIPLELQGRIYRC